MLEQIYYDLSQELKCHPSKIKITEDRVDVEKGLRIRSFVYKNKGFQITTNTTDTAYINIEPLVPQPNKKPKPKGEMAEWEQLLKIILGVGIAIWLLIIGTVVGIAYLIIT